MDLRRSLNISIERIVFNVAYPGANASTVSIQLLVVDTRVSIGNISFSPGEEVRPKGAYAVVSVSGQGPWNIYVHDEHLGKDLLVGVIHRSTDLIVQTGMYTALLTVTLITDLAIEISHESDIGAKLLARYDNGSREAIDLGVCAANTCYHRIQRTDLVDYELLFYRKSQLVYARIRDGFLTIYPWDNPHIFIAIPIAIAIAMVYLFKPHNRSSRAKRRKKRKP